MENRVAQFQVVSYEQFRDDFLKIFNFGDMGAFNMLPIRFTDPDQCALDKAVKDVYDSIEPPERATAGSAGYDFKSPFGFTLKPGDTIKIPTGIRCFIKDFWVLLCFPRSKIGTKYKVQFDNTVPVIDSDYWGAENQGHILLQITNHGQKDFSVKAGDRIAQGVFLPFGITLNDSADGKRNGGFGSTGA